MRMSGATAALVALEDAAPDELFATLPGSRIPLWPLLRWPLASALAHTQYETEPARKRESAASKAARFARTAMPSDDWSRSLRTRTPVLFAGPGSRNAPSPAGVVNPLLGPLIEVLEDDAAMVQFEPIPRGRRHAFEPTVSFDDAVVASELRARLTPPSAAVMRQSRDVAEAVFARVDHDVEPARRAVALRTFDIRVRRAVSLAGSYARLLDRVQHRLLVLQAAVYGDRSSFVSAAHERGIAVAEPQHGWVGASHGAYNFGAAARDPRLRATLPDTLLTFGRFWSDSVTVPFSTVEIGKPSLEDEQSRALPLAERPDELLYVSTVADPDEVSRLVLRLRDVVPAGWTIVFRPHPQERTVVAQRYPDLIGARGIRLDDEPDPYRSLARSRVIVGSDSTTLYEALALRTPTVIRVSKMTPFYMDPEIFTNRIEPGDDPQEAIRRAIESPELDLPPELLERVWASGSRDRFRRWADEELSARPAGVTAP
ncbi:MAG TPA: hypothetical protein VF479_04225 [Pseudolysinimonas sp.]